MRLNCLDCETPVDYDTPGCTRAYCTTCTDRRLHDPRKSLSFPHDEQLELAPTINHQPSSINLSEAA